MSLSDKISAEELEKFYQKIKADALSGGYFLNPDVEHTKALLEGLLINETRYGYPSCPCRLATMKKEEDLDIICPCDYRDADIAEYGTCFCGLYVSEEVALGKRSISSIPERRPPLAERAKQPAGGGAFTNLSYPVWRCKVCGYLSARDAPPSVCPICKAKSDRFERFA